MQFLSQPHDLASSADGTDVYVVEIGPNKVWKLSSKQQPSVTTPIYSVPVITKALLGAREGSGSNLKQDGNGNGRPTKASTNHGSSSLELVEEKARLIPKGHHESTKSGKEDQSSDRNGDGEKSSMNAEGHQESTGQGNEEHSSQQEGVGEKSSVNTDHQDKDNSSATSNPQEPVSRNASTGVDKANSESHTSEHAAHGKWVNGTQRANFRPQPTASVPGKSGPQNDALDSDETDDGSDITAGVIPALVILSVLAVPIVFLLLISITLRVRAYRRDRNNQVNGFHGSKKDLSVGRTRGWWSYMNFCDRRKYRFNRVTLSDFYSDSDSDGV